MLKYKTETLKKIEESFNSIIQTLKNRKEDLINEVLHKFEVEIKKIEVEEAKWKDKQVTSEKLLSYSSNSDDSVLLNNCYFIMQGINKLQQMLYFKEIQVNNDINTCLYIDNNEYSKESGNVLKLNIEDILRLFSMYMSVGEPNILEYKS